MPSWRFSAAIHLSVATAALRSDDATATQEVIKVCATPRGMVFAPYWSENGYKLCSYILVWNRVWFLRKSTGVYGRTIYRFNSKCIRKKEKCANNKYFLLALNLGNDDIIS